MNRQKILGISRTMKSDLTECDWRFCRNDRIDFAEKTPVYAERLDAE